MSDEERVQWERRYREGEYHARAQPSQLLMQFLDRLPRGRALDVACGIGRNARFLAERGYRVDALDISAEALRQGEELAQAQGLQVNWTCADLDNAPLPQGVYQVVVCSFYINRALAPRLMEALAEGGYLLYEHHLRTPLPVDGPPNEEWRLAPNELLRLFQGLRVLHYEEGVTTEAHGEASRTLAYARLVACKGSGGF